MKPLVLLPALLLAGCALPGGAPADPCEGRAPLVVKAYPDFTGDPSHLRFEVSLWNCRDAQALRVDMPCGQHAALAPRLDVDGVRYAILWNGSAVPEADVPCEPGPVSVLVVEPRHFVQDQAYVWNGTLQRPDGSTVRAVGAQTVVAELAGYRAQATVEPPT